MIFRDSYNTIGRFCRFEYLLKARVDFDLFKEGLELLF
ncbi:hypothetical protein SynA1560_02141 [Synechococcus sp. A15-60]|nr:hypothetical protein SynA1560_02141 [Synechococcus sp. A15-60]